MKFGFFAVVAVIVLATTVTATAQQNYFWIGNGGDWKDGSHWSLTSGGPSSDSIPKITDNVFFDANSFTLPGQIVFILDDGSNFGVGFKTMDWRGVTNNPTFQIRVTTSPYLGNDCYGSLYFADNMTLDFLAAEFYMQSPVNYEFDTRGHNLGESAWIWFNAQSAVTGNILSDINHAWIYATKGIVNFNGHSFLGINNANNASNPNYPAIWLQSAAAALNISNSTVDVGTIQFAPGSTLIDDNAVLTIRDRISNTTGQNFNYVKFGSVVIAGAASNNTYQTLEILTGSAVQLLQGSTQTVSNLIATGQRQVPIYITSSSPGVTATIQKSSGAVDLSWVRLKDIAATGGAIFNAHGAWNDGNVTGWNFKLDEHDREDLDYLYTTLGGSGWINNTPWESSPSDPRIIVDKGSPTANGGRVTSILLNENNLTGVLTGDQPSLDSLILMDLSGNELTGPFPTVLTELNLISLNLSGNQFTGAVPSLESTLLKNLNDLDLSSNSFDQLPDMTAMPLLTTLNVSGNNFDFEDLEKNASIITDDGLNFYQDQAPIPSDPYEEIHAGLSHNLELPAPGAGGTPANNSYQWKFKPYYPILGDTAVYTNAPGISSQEIYSINSVDRSTIGKYKVEVQNSAVPDLVLSSEPFGIEAVADIAGVFKFGEDSVQRSDRPNEFKEMILLQITTGGYDTILFNSNGVRDKTGSGFKGVSVKNTPHDSIGTYEFKSVFLRDYLINGFADTLITQYTKAIPTWYAQTFLWEEADTLVLISDTTNINIVSEERPEHPVEGPDNFGTITGVFWEGPVSEGGKINAAARVSRSPGSVRREQESGRGAAEPLVLVDYIFTNVNGVFTFKFLEGHEYKFNLQYPGYPMDEDPSSFIQIPIADDLFNRHIGVEAEIIEGKIFVRRMLVTGWEEPVHTMTAYPNPTAEYLFISGSKQQVEKFRMMDATGKAIHVSARWDDSEKKWELDVRELKKGAYVLQIEKHGKIEKLHIVVQ